jgi:hypothetical protein
MAKAEPEKLSFFGRLKQMGAVFAFTVRNDRRFLPLVIVAAIVPLALAVVGVFVVGLHWLWLIVGFMAALLAVMIVLSRRAKAAQINALKGQPGAAASIVQSMRGDWRVTPAVASTTNFDMVHVVIGRPGVILLAEGDPQRLRSLISQEKRRLSKLIGTAELRDIVVGDEEGLLPLEKLEITLTKLPRTITGKDVNALDKRLTALSARPQLPKGAIPKNMRPPKGAFRAMRGR